MTDYAFVDFETRNVHVGFDEVLPLATFWDDNGDECDWTEATFCSAGPDADGLFVQIDLSQRGYDQ